MNIDELLGLARPDVEPTREVVERHRALLRAVTEGHSPASASESTVAAAAGRVRPRSRSTEWPPRRRWSLALLAVIGVVGVVPTLITVNARHQTVPGSSDTTDVGIVEPDPTVPSSMDTETTGVAVVEPNSTLPEGTPAVSTPVTTPAFDNRVVVIGDNFVLHVVDSLLDLGYEVDSHIKVSSGLARPDFYDWPAADRQPQDGDDTATVDFSRCLVNGTDVLRPGKTRR